MSKLVMIIQNIIFFLNNIADDQVNHVMRGYAALVMFTPPVIGFLIVSKAMEKYRGKLHKIKPFIILAIVFTTLIPLALILNSSMHINQLRNLIYAVPVFCMLGLLVGYMISYNFQKYSYLNDQEYLKNCYLDGSKIEENIVIPKLSLVNNLFILIHILLAISIIGMTFAFLITNNLLLQNITIFTIYASLLFYMLYLIWFRWYFKCPYCHNPIYGIEKKNGTSLYFHTMVRIFKYGRFTCMNCHAHYSLTGRECCIGK